MDGLEGAVLDTAIDTTDTTDATDQGAVVDDAQDAATDDTQATDAAASDDQATDDDAAADAEADKETTAPDGRKMPDAIKKSFAALKSVNPEAAKELKGVYWANQDYRAAFPTVPDAVAAKAIIDEIGGSEGVQEIAAEREEWGNLDKQYAEGGAAFPKAIADSNPEAFVQMAPHVVNEWAVRAPDHYAYFAQSLTVNMLKNAGIPDKLERAYSAAASDPKLQAEIAGVYNSIVDMHEKAQQFSQRRPDPEREKLTQERQQFEQQRRGSFEEGVAKQAEDYLPDKMKPEVERILAGRKIDDDARGTIQSLVTQEVQRRLAEIPGFADKLEAFYRTGDAQKSIDYIKAQYNRILPEATKKVVAPLYRNIGAPAVKPKPAAPANGAPAPRSEVTLKEMPEWNDIDFSKCTTADVASGWAILKGGKKASGWI